MDSLSVPKVEILKIVQAKCGFWLPVEPKTLRRGNVIRYFDGVVASPSYVVASDAVVTKDGNAQFSTAEITITIEMLGYLGAQ